MSEDSFLSQLLKKKADVQQAGLAAGVETKALENEVDRQITQALRGGDPIRGEGVTKSGEES